MILRITTVFLSCCSLSQSFVLPNQRRICWQSSARAVNLNFIESIPFAGLGKQLAEALDVGAGLSSAVGKIPERETTLVLESIGYDLLIFLAASVVVGALAKRFRITPILGYLLAGALLGPHGMDMFANSKADVEFGDFGILFLLFSEGLDVSKARLSKLSNYLPLGLAQISLVTGVITGALLTGVPQLLGQFLPLDASLIPVHNPVEAVVLGLTGALSTSAFIFPVLKERGWEEEESGEAATSILLLQDLMVAPLLVILPYLVGQSETDYSAIAFLTLKATLGFGSVIYVGNFVLQRLFALVAQTQSSETFVATCLLVSVGLGLIAKFLGLTDTAGAFCAGVLLANTNYRAQIQADILPFKGILLGIFFMDAGSNFDVELVMREWPTVLAGAASLMVAKAITLGLATRVPRWMEPHRLPAADAMRVALLLSGGGEFAFVVLALAERLTLVPADLGALLTAIILITMGLTPLVGEVASLASEPLQKYKEDGDVRSVEAIPPVAHDSVVICGYGEIGQSVLRVLGAQRGEVLARHGLSPSTARIVAFDTSPSLADSTLRPGNETAVFYGNGANSEVIRSSGIHEPSCIFVAYESHNRVLAATARLRTVYRSTPIYARASTALEAQSLKTAGATEVVVESDELPKSAVALANGVWTGELPYVPLSASSDDGDGPPLTGDQFRSIAAAAAGVSVNEVNALLELYASMDQNGSGEVSLEEVENVLRKSSNWIANDDEIAKLDAWLEYALKEMDTVTTLDFCRLYGRAPVSLRQAFGVATPSES